ncbi:glycoside hydrolase family 88 protein [Pontibacter flavimaris]|uniref:Glucuronyl hydrolase n=1 Tax=Pontibacter flavimaris TaxID=1797110 RepID=A0A1Q5PI12_9BACT|nr:glycoside hydrolase family 88 protein [Pontibacter flavimaris]OKL41859.1 glucuronyl hydrolase [Pontibacter flavimaris]
MLHKSTSLFLFILCFTLACAAQKVPVNEAFDHAAKQTKVLLKETEKATKTAKPGAVSPRTINDKGELQLVAPKDWTSGFFPGVLWYLYEYTGDKVWLIEAKKYTANLEKEKLNSGTHDMGFKMYCSYGNGLRLTDDPQYRDVLILSAKTLATRFNPTVGAIRSWDHNTDKWDFPVIIDNMMNLELLFWATRTTGDSTYYNIAVAHANTTLQNHFRDDYSSFHVIGYNPETGAVEKKNTHQGYSHESTWTRGQAWGLYGYTMSFRETGNKAYLELAENIAKYMLEHPQMPDDMVPYWDYNAPNLQNEPRDASAAAVMASALYELSTYSENKEVYRKAADKMLQSLSQKYTSPVGQNKGFILLHSTGSKPHNSEIDVPLTYADYYYLEALLRQKQLAAKGKLFN